MSEIKPILYYLILFGGAALIGWYILKTTKPSKKVHQM